jgi:hypothetical protein
MGVVCTQGQVHREQGQVHRDWVTCSCGCAIVVVFVVMENGVQRLRQWRRASLLPSREASKLLPVGHNGQFIFILLPCACRQQRRRLLVQSSSGATEERAESPQGPPLPFLAEPTRGTGIVLPRTQPL